MTKTGLMQDHLVDDLAAKEADYWWHRIRRRNLLRQLAGLAAGSRILEIGSGTGANLRCLKERGFSVVGIELDPNACAYSKGLDVVCADATSSLPFPDGSFDAVVMLDVLEHLDRPDLAVAEMSRILRPGGIAAIMVPSGPELWSYWDRMCGHQRRYTPATLTDSFGPGWELAGLTHSFAWAYWPIRISRKVLAKRGIDEEHSDFVPLPRLLNEFLVMIGALERAVSSLISLPFGTTLQGSWVRTT